MIVTPEMQEHIDATLARLRERIIAEIEPLGLDTEAEDQITVSFSVNLMTGEIAAEARETT